MTEISNNEILEILKTYLNEDQLKKYKDLVKLSSADKIRLITRLKKINPIMPRNNLNSILRSSSRDSIDLFTPEAIEEINETKTKFKTDMPPFLDYIKGIIQNLTLIYNDLSCGPSSSITP
jgi:NADH dehydrogenase FAD-containing subunit